MGDIGVMKSKISRVATCIALFLSISSKAQGATRPTVDPANPYEQPKLIRASCYTSSEGAITYSGQSVRSGNIAGPKGWLESVALFCLVRADG